MNPPVVLSVRLKGDWEGPQTGDVVLDVAQVLSDIHHPLVIKDENGVALIYDGTQEEILEIYSKDKIDELTKYTTYTIVDKLPPVLDADTDKFYILPDGTINYIINNKWVNQATSLNIEEIVKDGVDKIIDDKLDPINDKIIDLETADGDLDKKIDQEISDRKKGDKDLQDEIDKLKKSDSDLLQSLKDEIQARTDGDKDLKDDITDEAKTRLDEDTKLANKISDNKTDITNIKTDITNLDTKITNNANSILSLTDDLNDEIQARKDGDKAINDAIDKTVVQDISVSGDASTVDIKETKVNIKSGTTSTENNPLPVASKTAAGVINPATYKSIEDTATAVDAILNGAVSIPDLPEKPTQTELTDAWKAATGKTELINGAKISDSEHDITYTYYKNVNEWQGVATGVTEINITTATNTTLGITKGDDKDTGGKIFVETDGSMSVIKWDDTQKAIEDNASDIKELQEAVEKLEGGGGQTLYDEYGENEDGALTQKFVTEVLDNTKVIIGKDSKADEDDSVAIGHKAHAGDAEDIAIGVNATSTGSSGVSIGADTNASGTWGVALGNGNKVTGNYGTAVGGSNKAKGVASVAIGLQADTGDGVGAIIVGYNAVGPNKGIDGASDNSVDAAVAVGFEAKAKDQAAIAVGHQAEAKGLQSVAIGPHHSYARSRGSIAIGEASVAGTSTTKEDTSNDFSGAVAIGDWAQAKEDFAIAIGNSEVEAEGALALGVHAKATHKNSIVFNTKPSVYCNSKRTEEMRLPGFNIGGVKAGTADDDAVNLKQMKEYVAEAAAGVELLSVDEFKTLWSAA